MKPILLFLLVLAAGVARAAELPSKTDVSLLNEVARAESRGLEWLAKQQKPNGSWNDHPAMTALATTALLRASEKRTPAEDAAVESGLKFILSNVKETGAIFGGGENDKYPNYSTAICTLALLAAGKTEYTPIIQKARKFLLASQFDEEQKIEPDNPSFGGIGYGGRKRPDMSNMQWALEAIRLTEAYATQASNEKPEETKLHWNKAVAFLTRCQNLPETNDQPWAKLATDRDKGSFIYTPGDPSAKVPPQSFADDGPPKDDKTPLRGYGSMTYAGLKSFIHADLKKSDPRVVAAVDWLKKNYTLDENPGLGAQGIYYYFHTFAKALTVYGDDTFTDAAGKVHDWRHEFMQRLVSLQKADGQWQNENNRWWEADPLLSTSYSLLALEIVRQRHYP